MAASYVPGQTPARIAVEIRIVTAGLPRYFRFMALPISSAPVPDPWEIVLARDGRYDGAFVYAVKSTGIYCRPSCPSKRPRPDQVEFYDIPETRSEERRVGKECRARWWPDQ